MPPTGVHFNGSVNLADTETVLREITSRVPAGLRRIPDGETGDRGNWVFFQLQKFLASPLLVPAHPHDNPAEEYEMPQVRLADGVDPAEMEWPDLGYAGVYQQSHATFVALQRQGVIPEGVRFQVQYPTPLASIAVYVVPEQQEQLLGSYERAMFADLDRFLAAVPHDEVAVQWDVAVEFGILEESFTGSGGDAFDGIVAGLTSCVDQVPRDVPVGLHLCYGDYGHQHFKQPESLALQVRVLDAVSAAAARPITFVSFTVPQYQDDEDYFAPLTDLDVGPDTELNFALVPYHLGEQATGTTGRQVRLIDAALAASPGGGRAWGICTECGMGRAGREEIPGLLDLHREIIATG
ncbi:MAG TPA: hypothetical protein VG253_09245 [Streptosporangiaceae bacterium]|jgi:hypothetical protein|nr:hypothetical protein [Streptosporangiaceae bacterium]